MPFLIEHITEVVLSLVVMVLLGAAALVALTITRRQRRDRYFQRLDEMRQLYGPVIEAMLAQKLDYKQGLLRLNGIVGADRTFILEHLFLQRRPTPEQVPLLRQLSEDLGLVKVWQRHLTGQVDVASLRDALTRPEGILQRVSRLNFLLRAKCAENLGTIRHQPSWPLLVKALDDPHPDVRSVAARSVAAIGDPNSFPALVERLHEVVLKPSSSVSLRAIKAALVGFPLSEAVGLLTSLKHSHRRIRFLAVDIIREMVEHQVASEEDFVLEPKVFSPALIEMFLTELAFDKNPDVRARTAPVIACLSDPRSTALLLTLLEDPEWFVRLHTVRALAKRKYMPQAGEIVRRLTDPHWMVREAAARALLSFGQVGVDQLCEHFLSTQDRYSGEQIADEMQRAGLIPTLLTRYSNEADGTGIRVIEQLVHMGKTSYLLASLLASSDRNLRKKFLENFGHHTDPQIWAWVTDVAARETDTELRALARASLGTRAR